jgi:hypothetical protein
MAICNFPRVFAAGDTLQIQIQVGKRVKAVLVLVILMVW